jgi:hypothetical protein
MIWFLLLEISLNSLNSGKLDKNNSICLSEFKNVRDFILTESKIEEPKILDIKNFKIQNFVFLIKDLKYKLSADGWTFVLGYKNNYFFIDHTSKAKTVYNNYKFDYFSRIIIARLVKDKNICIYEVELK